MTVKQLERAALQAHRRGELWRDFHRQHSVEINRAEPCDHHAYHRLVNRLLSLVVSGDTDGQQPLGDDDAMPWDRDDQVSPHDSKTQARCLVPLGPLPMGPSRAGGSERCPTAISRM